MRRRQLLCAATATLVPIAGCLDADGATDATPADDPSSDEPGDGETGGDETDDDEPGTDGSANESDESGDEDDEYDPSERVDPLYVHNLTPDAVTVDVEVVHDESGDVVLAETYRLPADHGARAPDVRPVGERYRVTAATDGLTAETTSKSPSCEKVGMETSPAEGTPIHVTIWTDDGGTRLSVSGQSCDEDPTRSELTYEHHAEFVVDEGDGSEAGDGSAAA